MATVAEQLQQLAALRKEGVLSEEEFEEQKRIILDGARTPASQSPRDPTMLTEVGAYRLLGLIGEGGMGAVYRGRHRSETMAERQGGDVAVKVIHSQYARNSDYRDRFEREAALGMKLDHRGIVKVHDLVVDGGNLALVMDFIEGRSLNDQIGEAAGPIPWDGAWPLFRKILEAVGYAHDQGVVHRDIKPENILLTEDGEPHVIDFGIAKDLDDSGTRTGTGMGTVEYMAPEQYTDAKAVDRRADIYSLGMILYEMLAGRLPWDADAPQFQILEQKARKQLMSPTAYCREIPREVVSALSPCVSAHPAERPSSTRDLLESLAVASSRSNQRVQASERKQRDAERQAYCPRCDLTYRGRRVGDECASCSSILIGAKDSPKSPSAGTQGRHLGPRWQTGNRPPRRPGVTVETQCPNCELTFRGRAPGMRCTSCDAVLVEKTTVAHQAPSSPRSPASPQRALKEPLQAAYRPPKRVDTICPRCGLSYRGRTPGMKCSACDTALVKKGSPSSNVVPRPTGSAAQSQPPPTKSAHERKTFPTTAEAICPNCGLSYRGRAAGDRCISCKSVLREKPNPKPRRAQRSTSGQVQNSAPREVSPLPQRPPVDAPVTKSSYPKVESTDPSFLAFLGYALLALLGLGIVIAVVGAIT